MKKFKECKHENSLHVGYDVIRCNECGALKTDSTWHVASNKWFESRDAAFFYMQHGHLPGEDLLVDYINIGSIKFTGVKEDQSYEKEEGTVDDELVNILQKIKPDSEGVVELEIMIKIKRGSKQ